MKFWRKFENVSHCMGFSPTATAVLDHTVLRHWLGPEGNSPARIFRAPCIRRAQQRTEGIIYLYHGAKNFPEVSCIRRDAAALVSAVYSRFKATPIFGHRVLSAEPLSINRVDSGVRRTNVYCGWRMRTKHLIWRPRAVPPIRSRYSIVFPSFIRG